jgi:hypothetical protein
MAKNLTFSWTIRSQRSLDARCYRGMNPVSDTLYNTPRSDGERPLFGALSAMIMARVIALFLCLSPGSVWADVAGSVCVENGGVISVNGKRSEGRCKMAPKSGYTASWRPPWAVSALLLVVRSGVVDWPLPRPCFRP